MINDVIYINPLDIEKFSVIWENKDRFADRIKEYNCNMTTIKCMVTGT